MPMGLSIADPTVFLLFIAIKNPGPLPQNIFQASVFVGDFLLFLECKTSLHLTTWAHSYMFKPLSSNLSRNQKLQLIRAVSISRDILLTFYSISMLL